MEVGVTAIGSPAAGAYYDARRGAHYTKPVLRGWLHVLWFEASLVLGPLLVARAHGATRITAGGIHLAWMSAPELLVGATFVGLGWAAGLALPEVWIHAGVAPGVLMLAGGLLYTAGALCYHRRPDPTRPRPCSATTRSSTPVSAPPRPASTSR